MIRFRANGWALGLTMANGNNCSLAMVSEQLLPFAWRPRGFEPE
jgi:hypothetical protein